MKQTRLMLVVALVLAIALTFVFGYRAGRQARRIHWRNEPIRAWMSVPFIAHTHHVSPDTLFEAVGVAPHARDRRSLRRIAREQKRPLDAVIHDVEKAIATAHPDINRKGP